MMKDKNGREIRTGDVVRISGAFFKNDNGLYFVAHSPGDLSWCGTDYSLNKICKNGRISTAKNNVCFWPIFCCVNNREKEAQARDWNREHAEIEVIDGIDRSEIRAWFESRAKSILPHMERAKREWGKHCHDYVHSSMVYDMYMKYAASCD